MEKIKTVIPGIVFSMALAVLGNLLSNLIPSHFIGAGVIALIGGMALNPLLGKYKIFSFGLTFVSKRVLRYSIVLMGLTLSFSQVIEVGSYSLVVLCFTLLTAFGVAFVLRRIVGIDWKLSSLISVGSAVCGGSAIAAVAPVIEAEDKDIAYSVSAIFIFDVFMVILFPIVGRLLGLSDMGFGLWAGTAINDTSSVVTAGYAFSDIAGGYATIVKLTRTLAIIPIVIVFSFITARKKRGDAAGKGGERQSVSIKKIFPFFILMFLVMVAVKSTGFISADVSGVISKISKFMMVMALGAIGLKTNFREMARSGVKPLLYGFSISLSVVAVAFIVQFFLGQLW
ncbi:YeiH family protein [Oscillospiraceae bacterium OttesenSCG-928-F05]|nr:YeiH family protein [Oscillospiraceae bacterium OttesenSCG-928-F05]